MARWLCLALLGGLCASGNPVPRPTLPGTAVSPDVTPSGVQARDRGATLSRRWYSVLPLEDWQEAGELDRITHSTWPIVKDIHGRGVPSIRYCFENTRTADHLARFLVQAIAQWSPAYQYSSMRILPDVSCVDEDEDDSYLYDDCICDSNTAADTMVITDGQDGGHDPGKWTKRTETSLGYDHTKQTKGRHTMIFGAYNVEATKKINQKKTTANSVEYLTFKTVHELGHAIGLDHEHAIPGRDHYVDFNCEYLSGYDDVAKRVEAEENKGWWRDRGKEKLSLKAKMEYVCATFSRADHFGFTQLFDYLPGDKYPLHADDTGDGYIMADVMQWPENPGPYEGGATPPPPDPPTFFDYGSIMHYSSNKLMLDESDAAKEAMRYPLLRKLPAGVTEPKKRLIIEGGQERRRRISMLDISRVCGLYPAVTDKQKQAFKDAQKTGNWKAVHTADMEDPVLYHTIGQDLLIDPNPPDVVGPNLQPLDGSEPGPKSYQEDGKSDEAGGQSSKPGGSSDSKPASGEPGPSSPKTNPQASLPISELTDAIEEAGREVVCKAVEVPIQSSPQDGPAGGGGNDGDPGRANAPAGTGQGGNGKSSTGVKGKVKKVLKCLKPKKKGSV